MLFLGLDGQISRFDGALLFTGIIIYTIWSIHQSHQESRQIRQEYAQEFGAGRRESGGHAQYREWFRGIHCVHDLRHVRLRLESLLQLQLARLHRLQVHFLLSRDLVLVHLIQVVIDGDLRELLGDLVEELEDGDPRLRVGRGELLLTRGAFTKELVAA